MQIRLERGNNMSAIGGGDPRCNHNPSWLCPTCHPDGYGRRDIWIFGGGGSSQTGSSTTDTTDSTNSSSNNSGNSGNQDSRNCNPLTKC